LKIIVRSRHTSRAAFRPCPIIPIPPTRRSIPLHHQPLNYFARFALDPLPGVRANADDLTGAFDFAQ